MSYSTHPINALIVLDPKEASKKILKVLKEVGMRKGDAAATLGCSHGTLIRWIEKLNLSSTIDAMYEVAKSEGWAYERRPGSGRPRGSKDKASRKRRWKVAPSRVNPV